MPAFIEAALWGLLDGSALVAGAAIAYLAELPQRLVATVMAIGSGVLISAVAFDLMDGAYREGGFRAAALGFLLGGTAYTAVNVYLSRRGGEHRKRSGSDPEERQQSASEGAGLAIAIGALLDGVPESVVIGASVLTGGVSATMVGDVGGARAT